MVAETPPPPPPPPPPPLIMIMSMASDLTTRTIVWAGRPTESAQQTMGLQVPITVEASWLAGAHASQFRDEALARLPLFTHED